MIKKITVNQLLPVVIALMFLNIILHYIVWGTNSMGVYDAGSYDESQSHVLWITMVIGLVISIPILCLILGAITSLFIDRDRPYGKRYWKGFLLTLLLIYGLTGVFYSAYIVMEIVGSM